MDRRQRLNDPAFAISMASKNQQARMWTALPGIIQSFNAGAMTAEIQPAIKGTFSDPKTGNASSVNLPLLVDCPVIFPSAGGVSLTLPIAAGDECLVIFASRCIDAWWQNGGVQPPMVYRMHDLSDGFCLPGIRSKARAMSAVSTSTAQLRSDDGSTYIEVDPGANKINIVAPGGIDVTGTMTVTGDIVLNGKSLKDHIHSGVQAGGDNSGEMA